MVKSEIGNKNGLKEATATRGRNEGEPEENVVRCKKYAKADNEPRLRLCLLLD
jgi:hypothetical protein